MNCTICGYPIKLEPSAEERSKKTGLPAKYYTNLFTEHADCTLRKRKSDVSALLRRTNKEGTT